MNEDMITAEQWLAESEDVEYFFSLPHAIVNSGLGPEIRLVLLVLASHTNSLGETDCQPDEVLVEQTGLDLHTVEWVMAAARKYGWVVDDPKYAGEYTLDVGMFREEMP